MIERLESFMPRPAVAYVLLTLAALMWAGSLVVTRGLHDVLPPIGLSFWRWAIATFVLLPIVWREVFRGADVIRPHLKLFVSLGLLQVGSSTMMVFALNYTTAINAALINSTMPVGTVIIAWLLLRERSNVVQVLGIAAAVSGVMIMLARGELQVITGLDFSSGDLLAVLAVLGWALYAVRYRATPRTVGSLTILFVTFAVGTLALLPLYIAETILFEPVIPTVFTVSSLIFLGLFSSVVAIYIWNVSIKAVGPAHTTIFLNLIPVFGAGLAITFLGEELFLYHVGGAVLVAAGIYLVTRPKRRVATNAEKA